MQKQYLGIYTRHIYKEKDGTSITKWYKAGYIKLTESDGKFMRLFHIPNIDFYCFEDEPIKTGSE